MSDGPTMPPRPMDLEAHIELARREGFYQSAYKLLEQRFESVWKDRVQLQAELRHARDQLFDLERELQGWRQLAIQYGSVTHAKALEHALEGKVTIARELALKGKDAIVQVCLELANNLVGYAREGRR